MVTSSVTIMTQTENETVGRKITLNAPKSGGEVITEEYQLGHHGTKIEIKVPVDIFLLLNSEIAQYDKTKVRYDRVEVERQNIESNVYADKVGFDEENIKGYTRKVLLSYLNQIIPNPPVGRIHLGISCIIRSYCLRPLQPVPMIDMTAMQSSSIPMPRSYTVINRLS